MIMIPIQSSLFISQFPTIPQRIPIPLSLLPPQITPTLSQLFLLTSLQSPAHRTSNTHHTYSSVSPSNLMAVACLAVFS
jgi:hypothetical protein